MNVFAVATVLNIQSAPESAEAWGRIGGAFRQVNLAEPGLLHFSWHVAAAYRSDWVEDCLQETARDLSTIQTLSTGLGIFTTEQPVLYLPVNKNQLVADLHHVLWERLTPIAENVNPYYDPEIWIPHITLAYENANAEQISQMASSLLKQEMIFQLRFDHLALIFRNETKSGIVTRIPFGRFA
jgi:2'-5' RNA ligase